MFKTILLLSVLSTATAFTAPRTSIRAAQQLHSTPVEEETFAAVEEAPAAAVAIPAAPVAAAPLPAKWLPIGGVTAPKLLDGSLPGDAGFDPLGLARTKNGLYWMREAEVKHGRLAMLAAMGWPLSELWHKGLAQVMGLDSILASGDRAPSLLNGGLSNNWATAMLMLGILASGALENKAMSSGEIFWASDKPEGYVPGDLGFDPLNLYKARGGDKRAMEEAEIKNGRLAMIAITGFAFSEFASKMPVVEQTPYLF